MNRIKSNDLPQADRLESVLLAVIAVGNGASTDIEIANRIPGIEGDDRQGRYYRKAAEMLGFIKNERNNSVLTPKGRELLQNPTLNNPYFIASVLKLEVYQKLLPFLELSPKGCTKQELMNYLQSIADPRIGPSMIPRRLSTILAWPRALGFLIQTNTGRFQLQNNLSIRLPFFEIQDIDQPLLPVTGNLLEFQEIENRTSIAREEIIYYKDQARLERANNAHIHLVNLVAKKIRANEGIPKTNQLIDLAARIRNEEYIFEMKSTTDQNARNQVRKGLSQLYEYQYLQNLPDAKLVLVIEKALPSQAIWMIDYLENSRNINLIWDGNNNLYSTKSTREQIKFLNLSTV